MGVCVGGGDGGNARDKTAVSDPQLGDTTHRDQPARALVNAHTHAHTHTPTHNRSIKYTECVHIYIMYIYTHRHPGEM